ncbi:MAG: glutamate--tRNA ligase, partial [Patescibacteria group bacterium]
AWLLARKNNGQFILRIEDTDRARSTKENEENILESLKWLGLEYDEFYRQSENVTRHKEVLNKLISENKAYLSKEVAKDGSGEIKEIIRFKNPNEEVSFVDEIKGEIVMRTDDLGDFVIAKNINEPLFHFAVVVDDFDEGVTHVIRGEDHVSNTPRQILIGRAIGAPTPIYAHLPLVLGVDKQKLSKRRGALAITEYRDQGYLPEAILNMVAMVGWNPGTEQELFTKTELVQIFNFQQVQKSPAIFNPEKLNWFNREYLKKLDDESLIIKLESWYGEALPTKLLPLLRERLTTFADLKKMKEAGELDYFFNQPKFTKELLKTGTLLIEVIRLLETISETDFNKEKIKELIMPYADEQGRAKVLWPMRVALTGKEKSPDPFTVAELLGKNETINRLNEALKLG